MSDEWVKGLGVGLLGNSLILVGAFMASSRPVGALSTAFLGLFIAFLTVVCVDE